LNYIIKYEYYNFTWKTTISNYNNNNNDEIGYKEHKIRERTNI